MGLNYQVLGQPGRDNALFVTVDTGQSLHRLLFDCGEGVLAHLPVSDVQQIEGLFFSHFHFDHVAGFDSYFRLNWCRPQGPVRIFGPAGAREVIHHRLRGVTWNLVAGLPGKIAVTELAGDRLKTSTYLTREGFAVAHEPRDQVFGGIIYRGDGFDVLACALNHGTVSLGYLVREHDKQNVDLQALSQLGLKPGPWLQAIKNQHVSDDDAVETGNGKRRAGDLRQRLLVKRPGESIAYLTDFMLEDQEAENRLVDFLHGCQTIVCENNYADVDAPLARRNFHMASSRVGRLAARVQPERLVLFHLSERYTAGQWQDQLRAVQEYFPRAGFPEQWQQGKLAARSPTHEVSRYD